ncbi:MAG: hypothetical protein Q8R02_04480 [Hyphomonadaceae bacterium]|nr:hypothetical protein [Hyphomonadaceae bacterium]
MLSEAGLSAILVSVLTGIGLTFVLTTAFRSVVTALSVTVPITLVMGAVMALTASDDIKKRDDKSPKGE